TKFTRVYFHMDGLRKLENDDAAHRINLSSDIGRKNSDSVTLSAAYMMSNPELLLSDYGNSQISQMTV
ncbi:MAG: hypothetical protein JAZ05_16045, partial [Candidatus Thiodiazotropha taylori]|nr:hypothetical protein [Candidatus Thiodiazotropha taylori]MCW4293528.1 hypothetical protein [Candidatus Thiodiazotropha taylori]